jgi:hypothetical protein
VAVQEKVGSVLPDISRHISNILLYYIEIDHTLAHYNYYVILNIKYWIFYPQLRNGPEFLEV